MGVACCFVQYSPVSVVWMPIEDSLFDSLHFHCFIIHLENYWMTTMQSLRIVHSLFIPDIKWCTHLHSISQETRDQIRPGSLSFSLQGTGRRDTPGTRLFGWFVYIKLLLWVELSHVLISLTHSYEELTTHQMTGRWGGRGGLGFDWYIIMLCWSIRSWLLY